MFKIFTILFFLFLNGCSFHPSRLEILEGERKICKNYTVWSNWVGVGRAGCLNGLSNYSDVRYKEHCDMSKCKIVLNEWKEAWKELDKQIIAESKANNQPLPENFKTADEIFAEYPNPCQDNKIFWAEVKVYQAKEELKKIKNEK